MGVNQFPFNVRVYGVWLREVEGRSEVLLCEEDHGGGILRKFPGGGLHEGEGPAEGLKREFMEEAHEDVEVGDFFYVSPNYQASYFRKNQLIALYWGVQGSESYQGFEEMTEIEGAPGHYYRLIWRPIDQLGDLTHPVDQEVALRIQEKHLSE